MGYLTPDEIDTRVDALAARAEYAGLVSIFDLNHTTADQGKKVRCLKIGKGTLAIVLLGGVHAREWAPPDALVRLAEKLLDCYVRQRPFQDSAFTMSTPDRDPADGAYVGAVHFERATFPYPDVQRIIDRLAIYIVPCVNRDGREYSLAAPALENKWWRTNRRSLIGPCAVGPPPRGVDINRNFPPGWDFRRYYDAGSVGGVSIAGDACDPTHSEGMDPTTPGHIGDMYKGYSRRAQYHGTSEASEPETRNVMELVQDKRPRFFIDVHSFGREIYYPWGVNDNQTADAFKSYLNPSWDNIAANPPARRGRPVGGAYAEYFPTTGTNDLLANHRVLGGHMRSAVLAAAGADTHARNRSAYDVKPSFSVYAAPGASDDFVLSTQLERDPTPDATNGHRARIISDRFPTYAFTMESGHESDGQFWPLPDPAKNQFRKVQREIQFAVLGLLKYAANWTAPSTGTGGGILDRICYIATAVYGDPEHPDVRFLRRVRDAELPGTRMGSALAERFNRFYYGAGPVVARWLEPRPFWSSVARRFVIKPAVWFFRGYTAPIRRVRDRRLRSALFLVALGLGALGCGVLLAGLVAMLLMSLG